MFPLARLERARWRRRRWGGGCSRKVLAYSVDTRPYLIDRTPSSSLFFFFLRFYFFPASGQAVVTGVVSSPPVLAFNFYNPSRLYILARLEGTLGSVPSLLTLQRAGTHTTYLGVSPHPPDDVPTCCGNDAVPQQQNSVICFMLENSVTIEACTLSAKPLSQTGRRGEKPKIVEYFIIFYFSVLFFIV